MGCGGCDLGVHEHSDGGILYAAVELAARAHCAYGHSDFDYRRLVVSKTNHYRIPNRCGKPIRKITGAYNENIQGVRVIKALNREEKNLDEFGELTGEMYSASYRAARHVRLVPAGGAVHQRNCAESDRMVRRRCKSRRA